MIELHRLDNTKLLINIDLIENVEEMPDTVITLVNGNKYVVKEKISEIVSGILDFKSNIQFKRFTVMEDIKSALAEEIKNELSSGDLNELSSGDLTDTEKIENKKKRTR